jgi:hypothetical protein
MACPSIILCHKVRAETSREKQQPSHQVATHHCACRFVYENDTGNHIVVNVFTQSDNRNTLIQSDTRNGFFIQSKFGQQFHLIVLLLGRWQGTSMDERQLCGERMYMS